MRFYSHYSFTHVDPFEDTESGSRRAMLNALNSFTHVDPFEDTESARAVDYMRQPHFIVSPTSIRSRILKDAGIASQVLHPAPSFTHVDPFEDTESLSVCRHPRRVYRVSPTSIRSRILKAGRCATNPGGSL